ncbi:MAG: hypothetical protein AAF797_04175 [Planctomycetota bacterium]
MLSGATGGPNLAQEQPHGVEDGAAEPVRDGHGLTRLRLAFFERGLLKPYLEWQADQPEPDPELEALVRAVSINLALFRMDRMYHPKPDVWTDKERMIEMIHGIEAREDRGLWEALALAFACDLVDDFHKKQINAMIARPILDDPSVHPVILMRVARWAEVMTGRRSDLEKQEVADRAMDLTVRAVSGPFVDPADRRVVLAEVHADYIEDQPFNIREALCVFIELEPGADPWITHTIRGVHEVDTAWEKRSGRFAHAVNEEQWAGFREYLSKARQTLITATKHEPGYPEPFTELIAVAMGGQALGRESERFWFDRAIAAQIDHIPAWHALMWATRPRWGGSHEQMLALGEEALATGRFDTRVPLVMMKAIDEVCDERDDNGDGLWRQPRIQALAERYYDGVLAEDLHDDDRLRVLSAQAAVAYRSGNYPLAHQRLQALGDGFNPKAWVWRRVEDTGRLHEKIAALGGPHADAVQAALDDAADRDAGASAALFERVAAGLPEDSAAYTYLRQRSVVDRMKDAAQRHERIDLLPLRPLDVFRTEGGAEWSQPAPDRLVAVGQKRTRINARERYLFTPRLFGPSIVIGCRVKMDPLKGNREPNASILLNFYESGSWDGYHTVQFIHDPNRPERSRVEVGWKYHWDRIRVNLDVPLEFHFEARLKDGVLTVYMDGKEVARKDDLQKDRLSDTPFAAGLGFRVYEPGQTVTFTEWYVQTLE